MGIGARAVSCYCSWLIVRLVARNHRLEQNADRLCPPAVPFSFSPPLPGALLFAALRSYQEAVAVAAISSEAHGMINMIDLVAAAITVMPHTHAATQMQLDRPRQRSDSLAVWA